jgi:hypothetical protein
MPSRSRPAAVRLTLAAALAAATLGVVSCASSNPHRAALPTKPSIVPAPPTTAPVAGPYDWARDASPALDIGGGASSILGAVLPPSNGSGWIVAGTRVASDGTSIATVWTSADGSSWSAAPLTGPQVDSQADAATTWRTGTVIVGSVGEGPLRQAAVWISAGPGTPFAEVAADEMPVGEATMTSVVGGALGLFAAGTAGGHVALWYSTTGQRWTSLEGADRVLAGVNDPHVDALLITTDGIFAAGWSRSGSSVVASVWTSGDGINWHQVVTAQSALVGTSDRRITALAGFGTGMVAVGGIRTASGWSPASWISPNGVSWSQPSTIFVLGPRPQQDASDAVVRAVQAIPTLSGTSTLVAVGGGPTAQRIWESADGLDWAELPLPTGAAVSDRWQASLVGVAGSTTVVADSDAGQPHLLVHQATGWQEPSADPGVFGAVQSVAQPVGLASSPTGLTLAVDIDHPGQILGSTGSSIEFLTSVDGTTWTATAGGSGFSGDAVEGLNAGTAGLLAVGWQQLRGHQQAVAWTSPDGRTWQGPTPLDPGPVAGADYASGLCRVGSRVVAVGSIELPGGAQKARAWVSSDGVHWTVAAIAPAVHLNTAEAMFGCAAASGEATTGGSPNETARQSEKGSPTEIGITSGTNSPTSANSSPGSSRGSGAGNLRSPEFDAFGAAATAGTGVGAAFWVSGQGLQWTRPPASPFGAGFPFPAVDMTRASGIWLVAGGTTEPEPTWPGAGAEIASAASGLWRSTDAGATWQQLETSGAPWQGVKPAQIDRVALLGAIPVVAGQVNGQLAIWTGIPS